MTYDTEVILSSSFTKSYHEQLKETYTTHKYSVYLYVLFYIYALRIPTIPFSNQTDTLASASRYRGPW